MTLVLLHFGFRHSPVTICSAPGTVSMGLSGISYLLAPLLGAAGALDADVVDAVVVFCGALVLVALVILLVVFALVFRLVVSLASAATFGADAVVVVSVIFHGTWSLHQRNYLSLSLFQGTFCVHPVYEHVGTVPHCLVLSVVLDHSANLSLKCSLSQ